MEFLGGFCKSVWGLGVNVDLTYRWAFFKVGPWSLWVRLGKAKKEGAGVWNRSE